MAKQQFSAEFELWVAEYYKSKAQSCKDSGKEFKLNLVAFRNLCRTQKCPYTGLVLTVPKKDRPLPSDFSIDRIDNSRGYVKGNVMAVSRAANNFKSIFENNKYPLDMLTAQKVLTKMCKVVGKVRSENSE